MFCSCHMTSFIFSLFKHEEKWNTQSCLCIMWEGYTSHGHVWKNLVCNFTRLFFMKYIYETFLSPLFLEQIPRNGLWFCNQTGFWYQHYDPHLPEHGHHDGWNWWPEQIYDSSFVPNQPCVHCLVHWRVCAKAYLPQILLLHHRLEHLWFCGGNSLHCR